MNCGSAPPGRVLEGERVEVLRGPQGTRYGQGSAGGVFIFRTRDPNLEDFEFSGEASFGQTRGATGLNYEIAGAVSVPLVKDKLAVRISGGHSRNPRSEEHTSELQSLMRISYAVFCLKKKKKEKQT